MAQLLPNVYQQFLDSNGAPLAGGKLYSYAAGTTTPLATYTDKSGGTPNANPTILDANGVASVWLGDSAYKLILKDSSDVQIWSVDNVSFINDSGIITVKIADSAVTTAKIADANVTTVKIADANVTTAKIADLNVTTGKINDAAVTFGKIDPALDFSQFTNAIECVVNYSGDFEKDGGYRMIPQWPWSAPTDISANIDALPGAVTYKCSWSANGEYLVVNHDNDSSSYAYLKTYQRSGDNFVSIASATTPQPADESIAFSKSGELLAITHSISPYVSAYQKFGSSFVQLDNPATLPAGIGAGVAWSPSGEFLAVAHNSSPYVTIYQRSKQSLSGTLSGSTDGSMADIANVAIAGGASSPTADSINTAVNTAIASANLEDKELQTIINKTPPLSKLTKLTNPSDLPPGNGADVAWSPDGQYLAVVSVTSSYLVVYKRSGTTFTKLSDPATLPASVPLGVSWSPNGKFLAIGVTSSPYILIYSFASDVLTKLSNPATLPTGSAYRPAWSPNGKYLAVPHFVSPYLTTYSVSGSTFTKLSDPATLPPGTCSSAAFSPNGKYLAVCSATSSYFMIYQTASTLPTNALLYLTEVPDV